MNTNYKIMLAAAAMMCVASANARDYGYDNDPNFSDITLINCGESAKRAVWTEEDLEPYVVHKYADGHEDWFFDAFLFVDTQRYDLKTGLVKKFGNDIAGTPGRQADWQWMLDQFFDPELKLHALDKLIDRKKQTLTSSINGKHKIVLSLCLPTLGTDGKWARAAWGRIDGLNINLMTLENRLTACKWYIDTMIEQFNAQNYKNLELVGVYWVEEGIWTNRDLVKSVNEYVTEKGLRSYWIPFYINNSDSWSKAHAYKFDMTYLQPNYAFYTKDNTLYDYSILTNTCSSAKAYNLGVELEFETMATSNALHEVNPALHQRINDYMDAFEQYGVATGGGIAYYTGSQGLIDMANSSDPVNQATMDRMADLVNSRQQARGFYSGIDDKFVAHSQIAYAGKGEIFISENDPGIRVFDIAGRLVHTGTGRFACPAGIYIVKATSGKSMKLQVR